MTSSSPPASRRSAATSTARPTPARTTPSSPTPRPAPWPAPRRPASRGRRWPACPTSTSPWARRPRTWPSSRRSAARSRTSSPSSPRPRAVAAQEAGFFEREIIPVTTPSGAVVTKDDGPRPGTTLEGLATLNPVFREGGTVTAGNACPLNDGAAAVIVMSDTKARELGHHPAGPHRGQRGVRPQPGDHGPRAGRRHPPDPGPGRHDHRRHRPGGDQ